MNLKRGQIWLVSFNPSRGSEQRATRPALIIQNDIGNKFSPNTIVLAVSSKQGNVKLDIKIQKTTKNQLKVDSFVKCSQILALSQERLIKCMGEISNTEIQKIEEMLKISLGI